MLALVFPQCTTAAYAAESNDSQSVESGARRVYVLDAPYLRWEDINQISTPRLYSILSQSALGNVICRSSLRAGDISVSTDEVASCIGSGYWRAAPETVGVSKIAEGTYASSDVSQTLVRVDNAAGDAAANGDGSASSATSSGSSSSSGSSEATRMWTSTATSMSEHVSFDNEARTNCRLGQILSEKGWRTAAIGCSDYEYRTVRPAAVSMSDICGIVKYSVTDPDALLDPVGDLPYESTNLDALESGLDSILQAIESDDPTAYAAVAVDSGDLYRAGTYRLKYPGATASAYWSRALASFDTAVGMVLDRMGPDDVLVVYSPLSETTTESRIDDGYGPILVYGGGYSGILSSASTGRSGLVTALDISATLAGFCGEAQQIENGTPLYGEPPLFMGTSGGSPTISEIVEYLETEADLADAVCDGQILMNILLCVLLFFAFGCSAVMLSPRIKLPLRVADIMIICTRSLWVMASAFPVSTYLMMGLASDPTGPGDMVALCVVITVSLSAIAIAIGKVSGKWLYSLLFTMALTVVVIAGDQLTGAHLARVGFLSYQPIKMGRFTGIGNEGAAVLFGAWMMLSGLLLNRFPSLKVSKLFARVLFPLLSLALMGVIIAPWWGSNFGALVWMTIGTFAAWWMFLGHRISWKIVLCTMLGCAALVLVLVLVDGLGGQSHLGVTASRLMSDGIAYVPTILGNMLKLSIDTLFYSPVLSVALAFIWLYLAWLRIGKPKPYDVFWDRNYFFKSSFTASMIVAVVVLLIEDSGLLLPALILVYCTAGLTWLICDLHRWQFRKLEKEQGLIDDDVEPPVGSFKIDATR